MKKLYYIWYIVLSVCFLWACSSSNATNDISKALGIDLSDGTIISNSDTHGGFHGDGYTFVKINFDDTSGITVADDMANNGGWRVLPLSENLQTAVYGKKDGNTLYGPFILTDETTTIPAIKNGYYYFCDRYSESHDPKNDNDLLNRHSFNFTIALYDTDNNNLYYYELDT